MATTMVTGAAAHGDTARPPAAIDLRIGQYNLPGPDKLGHASTRARAAARLVRAADLDVVTFNELVGPSRTPHGMEPSGFARSVVRALGSRWALVTPTSTANENYLAYRVDRLAVVKQHRDRVVPGLGAGRARRVTARHVTSALMRDRSSGLTVLVAATHLVNDDRAGAHQQARDVGRIVTELAAGGPAVVAGDMNTSGRLGGLTRAGLKEARPAAATRVHGGRSTFVPYASHRVRALGRDIIDQVYVPRGWTVRHWVTVTDARHGRFRLPRPSDHLLVWAALRGR